MLQPEILRQVLPALVTSVALQYPIAYIQSISFHIRNKMIAACVWQDTPHNQQESFPVHAQDTKSGCYIFMHGENIRESEVEINGMDEQGNTFIISMPYTRILPQRAA